MIFCRSKGIFPIVLACVMIFNEDPAVRGGRHAVGEGAQLSQPDGRSGGCFNSHDRYIYCFSKILYQRNYNGSRKRLDMEENNNERKQEIKGRYTSDDKPCRP